MAETVLLCGFAHETNTFADGTTGRDLFRERREQFGADIETELRGTNTAEGGVIDAAAEAGLELVYGVTASATPSGPVAADAYEFYTDAIVGAAEDAHDPDGVVLCLHGAMVPEGRDDGEGPLVERVREVVGPDTPIAATLDLHGNLSERFLDAVDVPVAFETYPHVDMADTGRRATRLLVRAVRGEVDPVVATERPPMADVMALARDLEARDGVLKANVLPGFHQADVPSMGVSIPVVADGDPDLARECAREVAGTVWERRHEFVGDYPEPPEAVELAARLAEGTVADPPESVDRGGDPEGPVVLADLGDNPGGGGAADGTTVLRALLDRGVTGAGFAILRDPEAVDRAVAAGVGETVELDLGGKTDDRHGDPIEDIDCYVRAVTDGEFRNAGPMATGTKNSLGRAVDLRCGRDRGVRVIACENRLQPLDAEVWRHAGIQPERLDVLTVKSTNHFRADYEPMASFVVPVDSPGLVAVDPRRFEYDRVARPKFPLDGMADDDYPDW
jgi:microcystin degradation protein MlrC